MPAQGQSLSVGFTKGRVSLGARPYRLVAFA